MPYAEYPTFDWIAKQQVAILIARHKFMVIEMLYAPPSNRGRWSWVIRALLRRPYDTRRRQIAELNVLGLSEHLRQDLGLVDARLLRDR